MRGWQYGRKSNRKRERGQAKGSAGERKGEREGGGGRERYKVMNQIKHI